MPRQFGAGEGVIFPSDAVERTAYILPPSCTSCPAKLAGPIAVRSTPAKLAGPIAVRSTPASLAEVKDLRRAPLGYPHVPTQPRTQQLVGGDADDDQRLDDVDQVDGDARTHLHESCTIPQSPPEEGGR